MKKKKEVGDWMIALGNMCTISYVDLIDLLSLRFQVVRIS